MKINKAKSAHDHPDGQIGPLLLTGVHRYAATSAILGPRPEPVCVAAAFILMPATVREAAA